MTQTIRSIPPRARFSQSIGPIFLMLASAFLMTGCSLLGQDGDPALHAMFTFDESKEEWTGAFSDYPAHMDDGGLRLTFERRSLPSDVDAEGQALYLQGRNESDNLFMYLKRKVTGLEPNTTYNVTYHLDIASNGSANCAGIGGSPGGAVWVKVGASSVEPISEQNDEGRYRMNVDKGGQSNGGENAVVTGTADNGAEECHQTPYRMIERDNADDPVTATTNNEGDLWLFVGTDSGFEGMTGLYYDSIEVSIRAD